jgi:hypothetical protein
MSPAVQKGPLGVSTCQRPKSKGGTPRGLAQGATARLGYLALLRSILPRTGFVGRRGLMLRRANARTNRPGGSIIPLA